MEAVISSTKKTKYSHLDKTTWCSMPWMHLFVDGQSRVKPCCRFSMKAQQESQNNLHEKTIEDVFTNSFMSDMRSKMIENKKIPGCIRCYQEEDSQKKSLRERYNYMNNLLPSDLIKNLQTPKVRWLELAISNDCNLACRMCDSRYAWKWFDDEKEFYGKSFSKNKNTKLNINNILPFLNDIIHIKFTGGEPLMIKDHYTVLDKLLSLKHVKDIFLNYSTNLTIKPSDALIEQWKNFKYIEIAASFDGVQDSWEYVRYPSRWNKAENVIQFFLKLTHILDIRIGLRSTVSVNNILNMPNSFDWWIDNWNKYAATNFDENQWINPTHLTFPNFLSTTVFPVKYKDIIANKLNKESKRFAGKLRASVDSQINYMYSADDSKHLKSLKDYTLHFDKKRNQDFFKVNPELKGLFDNV